MKVEFVDGKLVMTMEVNEAPYVLAAVQDRVMVLTAIAQAAGTKPDVACKESGCPCKRAVAEYNALKSALTQTQPFIDDMLLKLMPSMENIGKTIIENLKKE